VITYDFDPKDLVFDAKVREECYSCKRYGKKATCPPYIGNLDYYENLLKRYRHGMFVVCEFNIPDDITDTPESIADLGSISSLELHKAIMTMRELLMLDGHCFVVAFGAGSCKLCPGGCEFPCRLPEKSIVPIEATGINVIEALKKFKVDIRFPVKGKFYRIGAIFYD